MLKYGKNIHFNPKLLNPLNIDRQTVELIPDGSLVLDIGCATGFLGEYLMKHKSCMVDGVEMGLDEAKQAKKKLRKVYVGDVEDNRTIQHIKENYDVVNASAIIEHLKDPWMALRHWKRFLKKDGHIIISTSNIAHFSTRVNLIKGRFEYQEYGILDNTHLRFFTYNSFQQLIKDCGYKIDFVRIDPVGGGYPRVSKFLSRFFPNLFAYQTVIKAHL